MRIFKNRFFFFLNVIRMLQVNPLRYCSRLISIAIAIFRLQNNWTTYTKYNWKPVIVIWLVQWGCKEAASQKECGFLRIWAQPELPASCKCWLWRVNQYNSNRKQAMECSAVTQKVINNHNVPYLDFSFLLTLLNL